MSDDIDDLVKKIVARLAEQAGVGERPYVQIRMFVSAITGDYVATCWTVPRLDYPQLIEPTAQDAVRELARAVGVL